MIEEIQAILPLLEKISDGALFAFLVFMLVQVVSVLIWPLSLVVVLVKGLPQIIRSLFSATGEIELYRLNYKGKNSGYHYIGDEDVLTEFLKSLSTGSYIHSSDLKKFMEKIKNEKDVDKT